MTGFCPLRPILLLAMLAAFPAGRLAAQDLHLAVIADALDGRLDQFDLPTAALIAGGVNDPSELESCRQQLTDRLANCRAASLAKLPASERADLLIRRLHEQVLVGKYVREATDLRIVLARGDYNCLSALVLYAELCSQAEVPIQFAAVPGHVFARLPGDPQRRIEPTRREGPAAVPSPSSATMPRQISPVKLLSRFYYNRGVSALAAKEFDEGVSHLRVASRLDPADSDARSNLLAGLNNWALALCADEQPAAAARLIDLGLALDPQFPPLKANAEYVRQRAGLSH